MKIYHFSFSGKVRKVIKKNKKIWGKVTKLMKINEETSEKNWGKLRGKVRKVMKEEQENLGNSEESYEGKWGKFGEKWGNLWR